MWDIVNSLGLKEGLQEFQEQFNKDTKQTIAASQFAKDRGIDVQKLDELEQNLKEQGKDLHERTIGAAVDVLAKDETIAQLLEIKPTSREGLEEPERDDEQVVGVDNSSGFASSKVLASSAETLGVGACAATSSTASCPQFQETAAVASPALSTAPTAAKNVARSSQRPATAEQRVRQLEAEVRELSSARATAETQLSAARGRAAELEARWAELSSVSDDALLQAEETKQQVALLRQAIEDKDSRLAKAEDAREQLANERSLAAQQVQDLQASFQERLQREVSQKEQELLDEVAYLRQANETKDRRLRDIGDEKAVLEKRAAALSTQEGGREAMLAAHTAIAKAFGDSATEHPCVRLIDEPLLKFTALLFRQALFRRVFYGASAVMWVFAFIHAISPSSDHAVHI